MEYVRKQRWANYSSPKCKEYLRNDFSHECAYCKLQEQEVGFVGLDFFEIDHFKPQFLDLPDTHKYHNLYYSCEKCNNEKSDTWDTKLLDPCTDDIFSGSNPAIVGGKKKININTLPKTVGEPFILILLNLIPEDTYVSGKPEKIMKTTCT